MTSQQASSGGTHDVSVVFTVDGFSSDKTWVNLNTPKGVLAAGSTTVSNPAGCSNPGVYGGYDSQYTLYVHDLWNYAIAPITINEQNHTWTDETSIGGSSWHYSPNFFVDDHWSTGDWANSWSFVDHLSASNCSAGWTPPPVQPAGLNSPVQSTPQAWHIGSTTSGSGFSVTGTRTQRWYTDHGTSN